MAKCSTLTIMENPMKLLNITTNEMTVYVTAGPDHIRKVLIPAQHSSEILWMLATNWEVINQFKFKEPEDTCVKNLWGRIQKAVKVWEEEFNIEADLVNWKWQGIFIYGMNTHVKNEIADSPVTICWSVNLAEENLLGINIIIN